MHDWMEIDGSRGEGGGQVLRTALALSAFTGRPVRVHSIRARREKPGLAPQHLTGVLAAAEICQAAVKGAELGSAEILFAPRAPVRPGAYAFDVAQTARGGSAGSTTLLLQTLLLPLALAPGTSRLTLRGGTHVAWSPPFEYLECTFLPVLARAGLRAACRLEAPGFYPVGGGQISVEVTGAPGSLRFLEVVERGPLLRIRGTVLAANLPAHIPRRIADRARSLLHASGLPADIAPRRERSAGPGTEIFLAADYENISAGFSALGARGRPAEQVAEEACRDFLSFHRQDAAVDPHLADQLLLPLALAEGRSSFRTQRITRHLLTNAHVIRQFLPVRIDIDGDEGESGSVAIEGTAFPDREGAPVAKEKPS